MDSRTYQVVASAIPRGVRAGINPAPTAIPAIPHERGKPDGAIFCAAAQFLFYALSAILCEAIFVMDCFCPSMGGAEAMGALRACSQSGPIASDPSLL